MKRRLALAGTLIAGVVAAGPGSALGAFPQDPPNDPDYAAAENQPSDRCLSQEQYESFSFLPACAPFATDTEGASGMSVDRTWREFTTGDPDVVIAYVEGGINWRGANAKDVANQVYLNRRELPRPTTPDGDPALRATDYADSPDANGNGFVDPEDLIVRFSNGRDGDRNGYVDDISGWDFYDNQNDPATTDAQYGHAETQMSRMGAEANNGIGQAGICPRCRLLPIRAGAEGMLRSSSMGQAWLYAADAGAAVIVSESAELGYSTFMKRTSEYLHRKGVAVVESSNDFNSVDHQGGMFHPFVLPGNGVVADKLGMGPLERTTRTYRQRSSVTSWGTKNFFSVPTNQGSTSASDPILGGAIALLVSYGRQQRAAGKLARALSGPEVVQVMRATASDIDDPSLSWPSKRGWDLNYGYGRPNVYRAAQAIHRGDVPPVPAIDAPDWYTMADPTLQSSVVVRGRISAPRSSRFRWELQYALGAEPGAGDWRRLSRGSGRHSLKGRLGQLNLARVPRSFWSRPYSLSETKMLETTERYTVSLRLRVTDSAGRTGEDRRALFVQRDPSLLKRFPKRMGPGGEGQAALVDLQGRGRMAIVFGDTDGRVHAIDPSTARELPGWPVRARRNRVTRGHRGVPAGSEMLVLNVAVGDLDGDGALWVVATSLTGRVYAWDALGRRRRGFPQVLRRGVSKPPIPRPAVPFTRRRQQGALAAPVLGDLDRDGKLEIVQAAWDGYIHVFRGNGRELSGWPRPVEPPAGYSPPPGMRLIDDRKLIAAPVLADLDGDGALEIVERAQFIAQSPQPGDNRGYLFAYRADGRPVPGWPVQATGPLAAYGSGLDFVGEGTNSPVAADVDGDGDDEVAWNPVLGVSYLFDGDGKQLATYGPTPNAAAALYAGALDAARSGSNLPSDSPIAITTTGAFGKVGGRLAYAQPGSGLASVVGALFAPGQGYAIRNLEGAFDARSGAALPGFPATLQGLNFFGAPLFVDVTGDGEPEILDGGDSSTLHAFDATSGRQVPGFPKFTGGWLVWSPSAGDLDADGRTEIVSLSREGYLFVWRTPGKASANTQWWRWRHDEHSSGRYGADTRPPGIARRLRLSRDRRTAAFVAPGDDWYTGKAARYRVVARTAGGRRAVNVSAPLKAGTQERFVLPRDTRCLEIQTLDETGNKGGRVAAGARVNRSRC